MQFASKYLVRKILACSSVSFQASRTTALLPFRGIVTASVRLEANLPKPTTSSSEPETLGIITAPTVLPSFTEQQAPPRQEEVIYPEAEASEQWENVPIVYAHSYVDASKNQCIRVQWSDREAPEVDGPIQGPDGSKATYVYAAIEAANIAMREAVHDRKLQRVVLQTNNSYVEKCVNFYLKTWRNNDYIKKDGQPVKYKELLMDLDQNICETEVRAYCDSASVKVPAQKKKAAAPQKPDKSNDTSKSESSAAASYGFPVVYTAGHSVQPSSDGKHSRGGCGVYWQDRKYRDLSTGARVESLPTQMRCQIHAVNLALEQARERGILNLVIVTDNPAIPVMYHSNGLKKNGERAQNANLYQRMLELSEGMKVIFRTDARNVEESRSVEQAAMLAEDGLAYPRLSKAKNAQVSLTGED